MAFRKFFDNPTDRKVKNACLCDFEIKNFLYNAIFGVCLYDENPKTTLTFLFISKYKLRFLNFIWNVWELTTQASI